MKSLKIALLTIALVACSFSTSAHEYTLGSLIIDQPVARETPPGVKVGAGYLNITNNGTEDDTLITATGDLSPVIQIHSMSIENNVMKMQHIKNGLVIPAGESVQLQAGDKHIMFMNLPQQLKAGEKHKVVLVFEKAGEIEITFNVEKHKADAHQGHETKAKKHKH